MRFFTQTTSLFALALYLSVIRAAPVPNTHDDESVHILASRARPALTAAPSIGQVVLVPPASATGLTVLNAKGGATPHPAVVLSDADSNGQFQIAPISHKQASPSADISTIVPQSDLNNVQVLSRGNAVSLEGQVFTGGTVTAEQGAMLVPNFAPGSPATGLQTDSVNSLRTSMGLSALDDDSDDSDDDSDTSDATSDAASDSSSGIVGDAETAAKDVASDAESAVSGAAGDVATDAEDALKGASGSLGSDAADAAEDVGKGLLEHLRRFRRVVLQ